METKTTLKVFTICEYEKEQTYLRRMHGSGWKLTRMLWPCAYHFERCAPEDVIYQLDYNQDGIAHRDEYVRMFSDCGWEYLQDYVGYSYFRKAASEMNGTEEIFCDDASRLDMMKRVFKGRLIPLVVIFFLIIVPQIIQQSIIDTPFRRSLMIAFCILFIIYLWMFISFAIAYRKYFKSVHKE